MSKDQTGYVVLDVAHREMIQRLKCKPDIIFREMRLYLMTWESMVALVAILKRKKNDYQKAYMINYLHIIVTCVIYAFLCSQANHVHSLVVTH